MRSALGRPAAAIIVAASLLVSASCASSGTSSQRTRIDPALITREQIDEHGFTNAYDAVAALHSNWLLTKGTDSFSSPSRVRVYVDNTLLGGTETLRSVAASAIRDIRHFDGLSATSRWGMDHGQGVIQVTTMR
jgi:hypothetical protein